MPWFAGGIQKNVRFTTWTRLPKTFGSFLTSRSGGGTLKVAGTDNGGELLGFFEFTNRDGVTETAQTRRCHIQQTGYQSLSLSSRVGWVILFTQKAPIIG